MEGYAKFGVSLKVGSVQSLAEKVSSESIPARYVRQEKLDDIVTGVEAESGEIIPIIDFEKLFDAEYSEKESAKLHFACQEWGFFQLVNHGISKDELVKLREDVEEFFKLPIEEKEKVAQLPGQIEGYGQTFVHSEEQKLDWGDMLGLATFPPSFRKYRFWPTNPPSFRDTFDAYANEVKRLSDSLVKKISENLGIHQPEKFYDMFNQGIQAFRLNYYPPCPNPEKVLGVSPHSDAAGLTLLLQVNDEQGLQIRRNKGWFPLKIQTGAFIVNIGDIIEILSNGKYKSIEHRVVVNTKKERITIAGFHDPNIGDVVGPIPEIVKGDKLRYKSLQFEEFKRQFFAGKLDGKSMLERMKLNE